MASTDWKKNDRGIRTRREEEECSEDEIIYQDHMPTGRRSPELIKHLFLRVADCYLQVRFSDVRTVSVVLVIAAAAVLRVRQSEGRVL